MMTKEYAAYAREIINLTRSLVIKSQQTITVSNGYLKAIGDVDITTGLYTTNPLQWKYYLNLAGEYYTGTSGIEGDLPMYVYSIDTLVEIEFTKTNLANNPLTKEKYTVGTKEYLSLVQKYPEQEPLIRGIINPITITQQVIDSPDGTILQYDASLVQDNEVTLIRDLQDRIYTIVSRWDVKSFSVTDPLYPAANYAILILNIPNIISNLRLIRCMTPEVHDYHLWNYLSGFFRLDMYRKGLPRQAALMLYKDIEYISHNLGTKSTLDMIDTLLLRPNGVKLLSYSLEQVSENNTQQINGKTVRVLEERYGYGKVLNIQQSSALVDKIIPYGVDNVKYITEDISVINNSSLYNDHVNIKTGVLSCVSNRTFSDTYINIELERLQLWLYLIGKDLLNYTISTAVGDSIIYLTAKDIVVLLQYTALLKAGYSRTEVLNMPIPDIRLDYILTTPTSTEPELKAFVEDKYRVLVDNGVVIDKYVEINDSIPTYTTVTTPNEMTALLNKVYAKKVVHKLIPTLCNSSLGKSELEQLINNYYKTDIINYGTGGTFSDLFTHKPLRTSSLIGFDFTPTLKQILVDYDISLLGLNKSMDVNQTLADIVHLLTSYMSIVVKNRASLLPIPMDTPVLTINMQEQYDMVVIFNIKPAYNYSLSVSEMIVSLQEPNVL